MTSVSIFLKPSSPLSANMDGISFPAVFSISASISMSLRPVMRLKVRPMALFPEPGIPIRMMFCMSFSSFFVILPICVASGIVYIIKGFFDFSVALPVLIGSLVGAVAGCFLLSKLKNNVIVYIFSVIMIVAGVKLIF